ncbi:hypothetical protein SCLCIDRAFT_983597 [Scleroderma citrinum Foug A]|uniref:Uncharacterized protein n=1 Tax=Scleroderma citrinum Foug A TaxID=1036808 RepID=A0A0C2ZDG4_9AGAM|nr:hypothetical protein SCLCIDRAFT_983597 [Scleroderma citrinum Foug A]
MGEPVQTRDSSLKLMTWSVACMADGKDPSTEVQDQTYAFKCYGQTIDDVGHVWLVNALTFSLVYNTFASAAQTVLSQSGTTNSKSDSDNIQNTPVQSPPSRSTATWCV